MRMMALLLITLMFAGCSWFDAPRGEKNAQGTFIYYDFDSSSFGEKESVNFLFKTGNKSFIGAVPMKNLISAFYDKRKSIPFEGEFDALIIYDQYGRLDSFSLNSLNGQPVNQNIKAKDHN